MDDDDFYLSTYLEETVYYYRSTQADVVGRHSPFFFFAADGKTKFRLNPLKRPFCLIGKKAGHISGATLSAVRDPHVPEFSSMDRNSADSNWVNRIKEEGLRMYGSDTTSIVVFRDADETKHTWSISANEMLSRSFQPLNSSHIGKLLESEGDRLVRL
jgi:hypothetical protein